MVADPKKLDTIIIVPPVKHTTIIASRCIRQVGILGVILDLGICRSSWEFCLQTRLLYPIFGSDIIIVFNFNSHCNLLCENTPVMGSVNLWIILYVALYNIVTLYNLQVKLKINSVLLKKLVFQNETITFKFPEMIHKYLWTGPMSCLWYCLASLFIKFQFRLNIF